MPRKVSSTMQERERFVQEWLRRRQPLLALCEEFGISRQTGWKWLQRFAEGDRPALVLRTFFEVVARNRNR